ncbi:MAG TPA: 2-amino-4-hydroxy-6-hydroxymethyldihydropteridine diphosphokinase [Acidimicrobiales bacterium]|nr:2-amino-4-hydroxy-6-hydroxymethyldihydropteridine diphosphokinase [Acidimicrobiales bacterium]|tara:strand:- start:5338 stop:5829 length:492 start_codon:yes stop_codon:yes gene_type:complete
MKRTVYLGLGSNLGNRWDYLKRAVSNLSDVKEVSPVYETAPVGGPDQDLYLNCVVQLSTDLTGHCLLEECQNQERSANRIRQERWGPRTLDIDLLWIDGETIKDQDLIVPHPRMTERGFVLIPLKDLDPVLVDSFEGSEEVIASSLNSVLKVGFLLDENFNGE